MLCQTHFQDTLGTNGYPSIQTHYYQTVPWGMQYGTSLITRLGAGLQDRQQEGEHSVH